MALAETKTCPSCAGSVSADSRFCGACGAPVGDNDLAGQVIGDRYKIIAKLGEGGMGAVYRAEQLSLKREVALKLLKNELSKSPGLLRRFYAEAELAAKLNHPNTVTLFDFGEHSDGSLFIAMELVPGRSLRQAIGTGGAMPPETALYIAEQVCASLADAHTHGIVHRDLKPDNVMLTTRGRQENIVRVLDFGIAKLRDDGAITKNPMTQAGDLLGTPQYMAPEQIRGEKVDGRADVYAMGCMLYEMMTGTLPFIGPTVMAVLGKHLTEAPEAPSAKRPDLNIPKDLERIILECLHKDASARPASMEALGDRLAELRRRLGVPTPNVTPTRTPDSVRSELAFGATGFANPTPAAAGDRSLAFGATGFASPPPSAGGSPVSTSANAGGSPVSTSAPSAGGSPVATAPSTASSHVSASPQSVSFSAGGVVPVFAGAARASEPTGSALRGRRRLWLWALLAVGVLAGAGTTLFLLRRDHAAEPTREDFDFDPGRDRLPSDFKTEPERKLFEPSKGDDPSGREATEDSVPADFRTTPERPITD